MWLPLEPPTGDLACNPGMCPDWELKLRSFGLQAGAPHHWRIVQFKWVNCMVWELYLNKAVMTHTHTHTHTYTHTHPCRGRGKMKNQAFSSHALLKESGPGEVLTASEY